MVVRKYELTLFRDDKHFSFKAVNNGKIVIKKLIFKVSVKVSIQYLILDIIVFKFTSLLSVLLNNNIDIAVLVI